MTQTINSNNDSGADSSTKALSPSSTQQKPLQHYLQFGDFDAPTYAQLFASIAEIKGRFKRYEQFHPLTDRTLALIFEKASTRTRVSFEAGMYQLGGAVVHLAAENSQLARGEAIEDTARVIGRMVDGVMMRTHTHARIELFAAHSRVPVINGLTDSFHPCQVLADVFTWMEHRGNIKGATVAWVGDGNNMAHTWMQAAKILGFTLHIATPQGYDKVVREQAQHYADCCRFFDQPAEACRSAHLITTDVWTSMGQEKEQSERLKAFANWQVNRALMQLADKDALFMHCLPAHRGEEVTGDVLDGPQSVVWDEAENRLHAQKALLVRLLRPNA